MLYKIVFYIFDIFPKLRKWFWKKWYTIFAQKVSSPDLKFMNYGYFSSDLNLNLNPEDEKDRYTIQLYHHVASQIDLNGLKTLEVGSGRGGGAVYIIKYLNPSKMEGIDISPSAIKFCKKNYNHNNLTFKFGDSEEMPFEENTFDAVINVESSHCYASMDKFLHEVRRVLKPRGYFLFCDLRKADCIEKLLNQLNVDGLRLIDKKDITSNIIEASVLMSKDRKKVINKFRFSWFRKILESLAAVEGSKMHQSFTSGHSKYISAYCQNDK